MFYFRGGGAGQTTLMQIPEIPTPEIPTSKILTPEITTPKIQTPKKPYTLNTNS